MICYHITIAGKILIYLYPGYRVIRYRRITHLIEPMMFLDPCMDLSVGLCLLIQVADVIHDSHTLHLFIFLDPSGSTLNTGNLDSLM